MSVNYNAIPRQVVVRAAAALAGAGAYVASAEVFCVDYRSLVLYLSYDENAATANGAVSFFLEVRPFASTDWYRQSVYAPGIVAAGADVASLIQREVLSYTPVGTAVERWVYGPVALGQGVEAFRLQCAESGDVAQPGTFGAIAVLGM